LKQQRFNMKLSTAVSILQKEAKFQGVWVGQVLADVKRHGRMIYSQKVVEAAELYVAKTQQEELSPFATVNS